MPPKPAFLLWGFGSCPHCAELKAYLDAQGIPYAVENEEDRERRQAHYAFWTEHNTAPGQAPAASMPQLFALQEDVRLGGKDEVMAMPVEWLRGLAA